MLPKYVGSFTAEVRTVCFCHRFEVSSPFRDILRRNSEAIIAHLPSEVRNVKISFKLEVV